MSNRVFVTLGAACATAATVYTAAIVAAPAAKEVGGELMYPSKTIVANAVNSADHTTLVAAVKAAGLVDTLNSDGPFTVFAPTNAAFDKLPDGTVSSLLEPAAKDKLTNILTYHVIPGELSALDLQVAINSDEPGIARYMTVNRGVLTFTMDGDTLTVEDDAGNVADVTIADVFQSNGVIHVIDTVMLPG